MRAHSHHPSEYQILCIFFIFPNVIRDRLLFLNFHFPTSISFYVYWIFDFLQWMINVFSVFISIGLFFFCVYIFIYVKKWILILWCIYLKYTPRLSLTFYLGLCYGLIYRNFKLACIYSNMSIFSFVTYKFLKIIFPTVNCPGWYSSVDWAPACEPKGGWFDFWSGHMPGLQARCLVGGTWEATTHWCFSLSFSFPSPFFKNK